MRWIFGIVVAIIIVGVLWFVREPLMGVFSGAPAEEPEPVAQAPVPQTYASSSMGISFTYPSTYVLNERYEYPFGESKTIGGVAVSVGEAATMGTNLSTDSRLSVEQLPRANNCTADIFIIDNVSATALADGGVEYSVATSSGAGAGNFYEEVVYALPGSTPCTAVRYLVHSTNVANYPEGTVREFDRAALLAEFDTIRRSLRLVGAPEPAATTTTP